MRFVPALLPLLIATAAYAQPYGPGQQPIAGADISGAVSTAAGGNTSRSQAARNADIINVLDFGVKCDGASDDTARLQAAITAAAGKAAVYVPNTGANCMMRQLSVPSNSHITVDGTLKIITGANASGTAYVFTIPIGANNVLLDGAGTLDANAAGQTAPNPNYSAGVVSNGASNVTVRDLTILNSKNWPVNIANTTHCLLDNLKIINGGNSPQFGTNSTDCWARHLYITGINDESFAFYGGITFSGISESFLTNGVADGISVLNDAGSSAASHHLVINGNTVTSMGQAGVTVVVGSGGAGQNNEIIISNNVLTGNGVLGGGKGGIYLSSATNTTIENNRISKDIGASGTQVIGIWAQSSNLIEVRGNTVIDEGQVTGAIGSGIRFENTDINSHIVGNTVWDTRGTPQMTTGIVSAGGTAGTALVVMDNIISGIATPYPTAWNVNSVFKPHSPIVEVTSSGSSLTAGTNTDRVILSTGTSATFTLTFPAVVRDNQVLTLQCDIAITALTIAGNGQTVVGSPTACSATQGHQFRYRATGASWRMDY